MQHNAMCCVALSAVLYFVKYTLYKKFTVVCGCLVSLPPRVIDRSSDNWYLPAQNCFSASTFLYTSQTYTLLFPKPTPTATILQVNPFSLLLTTPTIFILFSIIISYSFYFYCNITYCIFIIVFR